MTLRWSEADLEAYRRFMRREQPAPVSEKAWQDGVMRLLAAHGYVYRYHTWDSRRSPSGFPDIVAVHREPGRPLLCVELKTDTGQVTPAQAAWLQALGQCTGVVAACWRPAQMQEIVETLRGAATKGEAR